jgi:hypothetical protein
VSIQDAVKAAAIQDAVRLAVLQEGATSFGVTRETIRSIVAEEISRLLPLIRKAANAAIEQTKKD